MKMIAEIVEDIREELDSAEHYAKKATQCKGMDDRLASMYATMSAQELAHVDTLHEQAVRLIQAQKAEGKEVPPVCRPYGTGTFAHDEPCCPHQGAAGNRPPVNPCVTACAFSSFESGFTLPKPETRTAIRNRQIDCGSKDKPCIRCGYRVCLLVEAGGVEPPSENASTGTSPGADGHLHSRTLT